MSDRRDAMMRIIDGHLAALREHFDACSIFVTYHDPVTGDTEVFESGSGNIYARYGQVRQWLLRQDEYVKESARDDAMCEAENDEIDEDIEDDEL